MLAEPSFSFRQKPKVQWATHGFRMRSTPLSPPRTRPISRRAVSSSTSLSAFGARGKSLTSSFSSDTIRGPFAGALSPSPTSYELSVRLGLSNVRIANGGSECKPQMAAQAAFHSSSLQRPESRANSESTAT